MTQLYHANRPGYHRFSGAVIRNFICFQFSASAALRFAALRIEVGIRPTASFVQSSSFNVLFDAAIPYVRQILLKPASERGWLVGGQLANGGFEFLQAHNYPR